MSKRSPLPDRRGHGRSSRSRSRSRGRDRERERDRDHRDRMDRGDRQRDRSDRRCSSSRDRDRARHDDRDRVSDRRDDRREADRRDRDRDHDRDGRPPGNNDRNRDVERKLPPEELEKQRAELEYQRRVEEKLKLMEQEERLASTASTAATPMTDISTGPGDDAAAAEREAEARRKRREAILAKHRQSEPSQAAGGAPAASSSAPSKPVASTLSASATAASPSRSDAKGSSSADKEKRPKVKLTEAMLAKGLEPNATVSAAERAARDREEREQEEALAAERRERERAFSLPRSTPSAAATGSASTASAPAVAAAAASAPGSVGAFDLFSDSPSKLVLPANKKQAASTNAESGTLLDNWDDPDGYYRFRLGDILFQRYQVFAAQGRGVFSTVLRVRDTHANNRELVIKVIRNNETMLKAGMKELEFCKQLSETDPENKKHCVRLLGHFEHRNHLCLVFEPMAMNLREVLKKFGGVGLSIVAVRSYAKQLFVALRHLKRCQILHGDLKPDNILVNEAMNNVKLCDFGSAGRMNECEITPYLVSRFYRAPEIMLGLPYGEGVDMWSVGCILFELYTGRIMFAGKDNNEMLQLHQDVMGPFPNKLLRRAQFASKHFDEEFVFEQSRVDPLSGMALKKKMKFLKPTRNILALLMAAAHKLNEQERRKVQQLADVITKCFQLDPSRRLTVEQALQHPFVKEA